MRLYNEAEDNIKVVKVENYSVFRNLFKSKYLFYLLIAYTVYVFVNAALSFLDGGVAMAIINLLVHGAICASLWLFAKDNRNNNDDKLELKSTKIFQIAHAVKYVVVFILLVLAIILVVFTWLDAANVAKQAVVKAQSSLIEGELIAAKAARNKVFWSSVGTLVFFVAFSIIVLVYYKAVMCVVDCMNKYNEKGTHFWNELKFLSIILFVTAGLTIVFGALGATGALNGLCAKVLADKGVQNVTVFAGGLGWLSFVGRVLFAAICVCLGLLSLKAYKVMSTTETSHVEYYNRETGERINEEDLPKEPVKVKEEDEETLE